MVKIQRFMRLIAMAWVLVGLICNAWIGDVRAEEQASPVPIASLEAIVDEVKNSNLIQIHLSEQAMGPSQVRHELMVVMDLHRGDMAFKMPLSTTASEKMGEAPAELILYVYNFFQEAYINVAAIMLALSQQGIIDEASVDHSLLMDYQDVFVPVSLASHRPMTAETMASWIWSPIEYDWNSVEIINHQIGPMHWMEVVREDIPTTLTNQWGAFHLDYHLDIDSTDAVGFSHQLNWVEEGNGLSFQVYPSNKAEYRIVQSLVQWVHPSTPWQVDTTYTMQRPTGMNVSWRTEPAEVQVQLFSIRDEMAFNWFSEATADVASRFYRLDYSMRASNFEIPSVDALNRWAVSELEEVLRP